MRRTGSFEAIRSPDFSHHSEYCIHSASCHRALPPFGIDEYLERFCSANVVVEVEVFSSDIGCKMLKVVKVISDGGVIGAGEVLTLFDGANCMYPVTSGRLYCLMATRWSVLGEQFRAFYQDHTTAAYPGHCLETSYSLCAFPEKKFLYSRPQSNATASSYEVQ